MFHGNLGNLGMYLKIHIHAQISMTYQMCRETCEHGLVHASKPEARHIKCLIKGDWGVVLNM